MIRPVILCGGAGTRLWPVSRARFPKQLLSLTGKQSLLQQTATRVKNDQFAPAIVVSSEEQSVFIEGQLEEIGAAPDAIILEPAARNTAAAATLAAAWVQLNCADDLLLLMPSDHVVLEPEVFLRAVSLAAPHAEAGAIVTFGAQPTEPNTQYGYIEARLDPPSADGVFLIQRFVEKPDPSKAAEYLATGGFYWNAGIFLLKANTLLEEMRSFLPESLEQITAALANAATEGVFVRPEAEAFKRAKNISIDHGIMEKTSRGRVIPVEMGWSDVGAWDAVWKLGQKDKKGNLIQGDVLALDSKGSLVRSEDGAPLIAAVGLEGMAVIATRDAVLIAPLDRVSETKDLVEALKAQDRSNVVSPQKLPLPWGSCESIGRGLKFEVNHIVVEPGKRIWRRAEVDRPEHWAIVRGIAEITIGGDVTRLNENQSAFVPSGAECRLANLGDVPLELIEVRYGSAQHNNSTSGPGEPGRGSWTTQEKGKNL